MFQTCIDEFGKEVPEVRRGQCVRRDGLQRVRGVPAGDARDGRRTGSAEGPGGPGGAESSRCSRGAESSGRPGDAGRLGAKETELKTSAGGPKKPPALVCVQ